MRVQSPVKNKQLIQWARRFRAIYSRGNLPSTTLKSSEQKLIPAISCLY